jgi:predicted phage terminase large subunit-like protein
MSVAIAEHYADLNRIEASMCRDSFYEFVKRHWSIIITDDPVWNWHIRVICEELQLVAERIFKGQPKLYDLIINVPPGSTKSTIASIMFPAWCWTRMKNMRVIGASNTYVLALDHSRKGRIIVKSDQYQRLFNVKLREDQDTKQFYETEEGGDRHAVGTGGLIMGFHGHILLGDDLIDPRGVRSEAEIKTASEWVRETYMSRKVSKTVSVFILIMQRLHELDPTGMLLQMAKDDPNYKLRHICLPAEDSDKVSHKRMRLKYTSVKIEDGTYHKILDPVRIPWEAMQEAKGILGPFGYAGQYEQWPVPPEGGMFKVAKIRVGIPPPMMRFRRIIRYWDKAGTGGGDGAETAGVLMGEYIEVIDGKIKVRDFWLLDVIAGRWDSGERENIIKQTAQADGKNVTVMVEQEPGSGGKESANDTIRNLAGFNVVKDKVTGSKALRADPFAHQVNNGNVCAKAGAAWWSDYRDQLMLFPFGKLKDKVDASSGAFAGLTQSVQIGSLFAARKR